MTSPAAPQLDYAPPSRRRWRWWWRAAAVISVLAALAFVGYRYGPSWYRHAQLMALERQCLRYTAPADLVVFTTDAAARRDLFVGGRGYRAFRGSRDHSFRDGYVWFAPPIWAKYPPGRWNPGPGFLHGRTAPGGVSRLVAVDLSRIDVDLYFFPRVVIPATLRTDPRLMKNRLAYRTRLDVEDAVTVFAGQVDPADASHFTIALTTNGQSNILDGWLRDDGTVWLKPQGGYYLEGADNRGGWEWVPASSKRIADGRKIRWRTLVPNHGQDPP